MSSSSIVLGSTLEIPPSIPIFEEAREIVLWPPFFNPARKKQMSSRVVFPEKRFKATHDVDYLGSSDQNTRIYSMVEG